MLSGSKRPRDAAGGDAADVDGQSGPSDTLLFIGNLSPRISEFQLLQVLRPFGSISSFNFVLHRGGPEKGKPKGFAFVEYGSSEVAKAAVEGLQGLQLDNKTLVVRFSDPAGAEAHADQGGKGKGSKGGSGAAGAGAADAAGGGAGSGGAPARPTAPAGQQGSKHSRGLSGAVQAMAGGSAATSASVAAATAAPPKKGGLAGQLDSKTSDIRAKLAALQAHKQMATSEAGAAAGAVMAKPVAAVAAPAQQGKREGEQGKAHAPQKEGSTAKAEVPLGR